jgi:hypothetical protein
MTENNKHTSLDGRKNNINILSERIAWHRDTQHNDNQHNDAQYNEIWHSNM